MPSNPMKLKDLYSFRFHPPISRKERIRILRHDNLRHRPISNNPTAYWYNYHLRDPIQCLPPHRNVSM